MHVRIDSEDYPVEEHLDRCRRALIDQPMPVHLDLHGWERHERERFGFRLEATELPGVTLTRVRYHLDAVAGVRRTHRLIRRADPEAFRLLVNLRGHALMAHGGRAIDLEPGELTLVDSSRPFHVLRIPRGGPEHELLMVTVPRAELAVPPSALPRLTAARIPARRGLTGPVGEFLTWVVHDAGRFPPDRPGPLATAVLDLVVMLLSTQPADAAGGLPQTSRSMLLEQAQSYIERRLGDASLSPASVAGAHHVSVRQLQAAFHDHELTVSSWIRAQRLDRCRRDLGSPALTDRPVHAIGARWGFPNPAHFSRVFEAAFGMSPLAYRRSSLHSATSSPGRAGRGPSQRGVKLCCDAARHPDGARLRSRRPT